MLHLTVAHSFEGNREKIIYIILYWRIELIILSFVLNKTQFRQRIGKYVIRFIVIFNPYCAKLEMKYGCLFCLENKCVIRAQTVIYAIFISPTGISKNVIALTACHLRFMSRGSSLLLALSNDWSTLNTTENGLASGEWQSNKCVVPFSRISGSALELLTSLSLHILCVHV